MKKLGNILLCILPFLLALSIQMAVSVISIFIIAFIQGIKMASQGETDPNTIINTINGVLNSDILLGISAFTAFVCLIVFGFWYRNILKNEERNRLRNEENGLAFYDINSVDDIYTANDISSVYDSNRTTDTDRINNASMMNNADRTSDIDMANGINPNKRRFHISEKSFAQKLKRTFTLKNILLIILLGASLQFALSIALNIIAAIRPEWFDDYSKLMEDLGAGNSLISFVYIAVIAPFSEELIFRGVILAKARKIVPFGAANILQALLFGIYHMNLIQGIYAFLIGMFLGLVCMKMRSVFGSILLHMSINISGILLNIILTIPFMNTTLAIAIIGVLSVGTILYSTMMLKRIGEGNTSYEG